MVSHESLKEFTEVWFQKADPSLWTIGLEKDLAPSHIGWRCADEDEYERIRAGAESLSDFLYQSRVNGRRVLLARLTDPLKTPLGPVRLLEVMAPKHGGGHGRRGMFDRIEAYPRPGTDLDLRHFTEMLKGYNRKVTVPEEGANRPVYKVEFGPHCHLRIAPGPLLDHVVHREIFARP